MSLFPRSSGVLLHPTSLPGPYGIGDLGNWAYTFVDWLEENDQTVWQIQPLGPTSYGDSPYQTLSAFAGNPNLISFDQLVEDDWLDESDLADVPDFPASHVDFGPVIEYHDRMLDLAFERFEQRADPYQRSIFAAWARDQAYWLDDYALFVALKTHLGGKPWVEWPQELALRDPGALETVREEHATAIRSRKFRQWVFYHQWNALKDYCNDKDIRIFGDLPIFIAHDSADVWANRHLFFLDGSGNPTVVAGVPPDYFSETGQRWGNPLYRWDLMKDNGYRWWIQRLRAIFETVDYARIDHFRGFEAYWEIPAEEDTAVKGEWMPGPGHDFFHAIKDALGELPIIAEDLGVITEGVVDLRDNFNLPGMKVLQFAWSDPTNPFLPHNHLPNSVVYTGTHDNNTTIGWWEEEASDDTRQFISDYLDQEVKDPAWMLMKIGMRSSAHTFILTMQDALGLGAEARMNTPGQPAGNWSWRFTPEQFDNDVNGDLAHLTWLYQRRSDQQVNLYGDVAMQGDQSNDA